MVMPVAFSLFPHRDPPPQKKKKKAACTPGLSPTARHRPEWTPGSQDFPSTAVLQASFAALLFVARPHSRPIALDVGR